MHRRKSRHLYLGVIKFRSSSIIQPFRTSNSWFKLSINTICIYARDVEHLFLKASILYWSFWCWKISWSFKTASQEWRSQKAVQKIDINFSAQTTALRTQQAIKNKLEKKKRSIFWAAIGKSISVFFDDLNMPAVEQYGTQSPIEMMRLFFTKEDFTIELRCLGKMLRIQKYVHHLQMVVEILRLLDLFDISTYFDCQQVASWFCKQFLVQFLTGFLKSGFMDTVKKLQEACVNSTIEIYTMIVEDLRPTPAWFHYLINLRDVSRVIQGILMVRPISCQSPDSFSRLWVNEISRVFKDRLIDTPNKEWFNDNVSELVNSQFRVSV